MASSAIALCEIDDDQVQGIAAGPTHADVIVTAQESGVFLYSTVSKVIIGEARAHCDGTSAQQIVSLYGTPGGSFSPLCKLYQYAS